MPERLGRIVRVLVGRDSDSDSRDCVFGLGLRWFGGDDVVVVAMVFSVCVLLAFFSSLVQLLLVVV